MSPERLARQGVCTVPEGRGIFRNLTVAENLRMWTFRGGLKASEIEEAAYQRFPQLAQRRRQLAGTLSGGEQQMLAMSRALSTNPRLLLLDEISMGLAPLVVAQLYELVADIAREGFTILVVEQFASVVLGVASRAAIMIRGRIALEGTSSEIEEATESGPPRAFRTAEFGAFNAASCRFRYSSWASCGVRYPSPEWRRLRL
jgi:branched-chain amino acid transport system ATP-binding protein